MAFLRRFSKNEMNLKTKVSFVDFYDVGKSIEFNQFYINVSTLFILTYFIFYKKFLYFVKN